MNKMILIICALFLLQSGAKASDSKDAFPEEELARESVLPVFDLPNSVRNRNVPVAGKLEVGAFVGSVADEAIFKQLQYGAMGTFHFTEVHGFNVSYARMDEGVGNYAQQIMAEKPTLKLDRAYGPQAYLLANYQYTAFYGKMSILKKVVVNTHIYGLAGLGTVFYDGANAFAFDFGLGQRFYFLPNFAFRLDLKFVRFNGANPIKNLKSYPTTGRLDIADYDNANFVLSHITGGLVFLF